MPTPDELKTEAAAVLKELDYIKRQNELGAASPKWTLSEPMGRAIALIRVLTSEEAVAK